MLSIKSKTSIAVSLLLLSFSCAKAQRSLEVLSISGQYSPQNEIENSAGNTNVFNGMVSAKIPVVFKNKKTIWYNNFTYLYSQLSTSMAPDQPDVLSMNLQGMILQTGLVQKLDKKHAVQILLAPRLMNGGSWQNADFQPGVIALFEKRFNNALLMRYGALYNQDLFGPMLIPLVYLYYQKDNSPWSFEGLLPIKSKIRYRVNPDLSVGFKHLGLVTSYPLPDNQPKSYLERKSIDLSLFTQYRLYKNIHLELNGGYALNRDYAQYASEDQLDMRIAIAEIGEERSQLNPTFRDGLFFGMRFVYQVLIDQQQTGKSPSTPAGKN